MKIAGWSLATLIILFALVINVANYYSGYNNPDIGVKELFTSGMSLLFICFILITAIQIFIIWAFVDQVTKLKSFVEHTTEEITQLKAQVNKILEDLKLLI